MKYSNEVLQDIAKQTLKAKEENNPMYPIALMLLSQLSRKLPGECESIIKNYSEGVFDGT